MKNSVSNLKHLKGQRGTLKLTENVPDAESSASTCIVESSGSGLETCTPAGLDTTESGAGQDLMGECG
ncbi:hypothetical protein M9458_052690, partial [Cirrhinus mrigala]